MYIIDLILHIDKHLQDFILNYNQWVYVILFLIIFIETGIVIMPFLPGDALLFAAGTFCANPTVHLDLWIILPVLLAAAVLGDASNFMIGKYFGERLLQTKFRGKPLIKAAHLDKTHHFFEKHGPKTIIMARFVPIVRTLAPFVAGIGKMHYRTFAIFNIIGGLIWVVGVTMIGYFLGSVPVVKEHFESVVFLIIFISIVPVIIGYVKAKMQKKQEVGHHTPNQD